MTTHLRSQSEAFTGMTALHGSSISMQFLSYLKELTPLCEHRPEMIFPARIRLEFSKQNPVYAAYTLPSQSSRSPAYHSALLLSFEFSEIQVSRNTSEA